MKKTGAAGGGGFGLEPVGNSFDSKFYNTYHIGGCGFFKR